MSTTIVTEETPLVGTPPVETAEVQANAIEAVADATVEVAEIEAKRDIAIAEIEAETDEARIEAVAEVAEEEVSWRQRIEAQIAENREATAANNTLLTELQATLLPPNPQAVEAESLEVIEASQEAPEPAPRKPRRKIRFL